MCGCAKKAKLILPESTVTQPVKTIKEIQKLKEEQLKKEKQVVQDYLKKEEAIKKSNTKTRYLI